ncbi:negative regulator of DNA transposition [Mucor ambiguus]|uniref:Negative regulator of DNA transposition n=1 Tax=Mucor ambiguus TaxID=91626 RepID=A0A0C9MXC6_9FUNG|nr:negative regulator of DNA transposition [Mucor ambiguus]
MSLTWLNQSIDDPNLVQSVQDLIKAYPASSRVIERLVQYYDTKAPSDRDAKRRKLDEKNALSSDEILRIMDISFQLPARKKLDLIITRTRLILFNPKLNAIEVQYNLDDLSQLGGACVPSPDKAVKSYTYTLFLKTEDVIVFNTQDKVNVTLKKPDTEDQILETNKHEVISQLITEHARVPITQPSKEYFRSTGVSSTTGKLEDRSHVIGYLKAKDGFLFFLPTGILFGFKKPTLFFPISSLASTVITNITQRTFDLTLTLRPESKILGSAGFRTTKEGDDDTVQFSMIEQSEYGGIEAYTKKLNINDHSMAEERKAASKGDEQNESTGEHHDIDDGQDTSENDEDFEPSDDENEPLEFDTDASADEDDDEDDEDAQVQADKELAQEEEHEFEDAVMSENEDQEELLDESD